MSLRNAVGMVIADTRTHPAAPASVAGTMAPLCFSPKQFKNYCGQTFVLIKKPVFDIFWYNQESIRIQTQSNFQQLGRKSEALSEVSFKKRHPSPPWHKEWHCEGPAGAGDSELRRVQAYQYLS